jgi:hypothetical protein
MVPLRRVPVRGSCLDIPLPFGVSGVPVGDGLDTVPPLVDWFGVRDGTSGANGVAGVLRGAVPLDGIDRGAPS